MCWLVGCYIPQSLTAMDLSGGMLQQARATVATSPALSSRPITFEQCSVEALPFADGSFDCVLDTFSLCVFPRPLDALREMRRVVRPGGAVLLLEHSRSTSSPLLAAYQDLTAAPVAKLSKGCVWNQDVVGLAAAAGLRVVDSSSYTAGTLVMLRATKDAA